MDQKLANFLGRVFTYLPNEGKSYLLVSRVGRKRDVPISANGVKLSPRCLKNFGVPLKIHLTKSLEKLAMSESKIVDPSELNKRAKFFAESFSRTLSGRTNALGTYSRHKSIQKGSGKGKVTVSVLDAPKLKASGTKKIASSRISNPPKLKAGAHYQPYLTKYGPVLKGMGGISGGVRTGPVNRIIM